MKLKLEHATHALITLFGVTSFANVRAFLYGAGHDEIASFGLALALGASLVVISIAITRIDWQAERQTFYALAGVGILLALISGALQSAEYATHLEGLWPYLLGYGVPVVGEIGLSLATALFVKAQSRSDLHSVHAKMSATVTTALDDALATFDTGQIRKRIDRSLNGIAARAVDGVTNEIMAMYDTVDTSTDIPVSPKSEGADGENMDNFTTITDLSAARSEKANDRKARCFHLIQQGDLPLSGIASDLGVTERTVKNYLADFRDAGYNIAVNGVVKLA